MLLFDEFYILIIIFSFAIFLGIISFFRVMSWVPELFVIWMLDSVVVDESSGTLSGDLFAICLKLELLYKLQDSYLLCYLRTVFGEVAGVFIGFTSVAVLELFTILVVVAS